MLHDPEMTPVHSIGRKGRERGRKLLVFLILIAATAVAYLPVTGYDFVNFDDHLYVQDNSQLRKGLCLESIVWAFTNATAVTNYWVPLTWLSFLTDYELHGPDPGGYHLTNLLLHILTTLVLFGVLYRMTKAFWRSGLVAALFALHPLHVESVAWITERKDVLSGFFWFSTMGVYAWYSEKPGLRRYLPVLCLFLLGLMAKPMLVTLPFVLFLVDLWPIERLTLRETARGTCGPGRLILEKVPLILISLIFSVAAFVTQARESAVVPLTDIPTRLRLSNVLVSYVSYLYKTIWPRNLAVIYPYPTDVPAWQPLGALLLLSGVGFLAVRFLKRAPYFLVGWLWYVGTLVPVIGLVVIGPHAMADRYTYLPLVGIFIIVAWGGAALLNRLGIGERGVGVLVAITLISMTTATRFQVRHWKDSIHLFSHALAVTERNAVAEAALGSAYGDAGRLEEAIAHYRQALQIRPDFRSAHYGLGLALIESGEPDGATPHLQKALALHPGDRDREKILVALGFVMERLEKPEEAAALFREAIDIVPRDAQAHAALGNLLAGQHKTAEAIAHYAEAATVAPGSAAIHNGLARLLLKAGDIDGALNHYRKAVRLDPDSSEGHFVLGRYSLEGNDPSEAIRHFREGLRNSPNNARAHFYLGIALTRKNDLAGAAESFFEAVRIDPEFAEAYHNLGMVLGKLGRKESAAAAFRNALRIRPAYRLAREHLEQLNSRKE